MSDEFTLPRNKVAIVGVGTTPFGDLYEQPEVQRSSYNLGQTALAAALDDSGLTKDDIDGLVIARIPSYQRMADLLGMRHLKLINRFDGSGRMSSLAVAYAAMAIATGQATTVACVYGNDGKSNGARYGGDEGASPTGYYDTAYGMTSPGAYVGMMYRRYAEEYSLPDGALAPIAINNRINASMNPIAVMRSPLTEEDYLSSRFIAEPLRLYDYCLINDGGVALILTSAERAKDLKKPAALITSTATMSDITNYYTSTDYFYAASQSVASRTYAAAGLGPNDIDCLQIYDNFTPTVLFGLEGFNHCAPGTAWEWIKGGRIGINGEKPVNTSGGHTSESYMQGWALHVEAVRQLRQECGDRQVPGCEVAQYICPAPIVSSHILTRQ